MSTAKAEFVTDTKGHKKAVVLPIKQYEQLMEDLHDLAVVAERRDEAPVNFEEMKKRLRKRGVL
jgi:PHD/YefM family antitoxin component YafN of YafNO toxin-antitoxin module